MKDIYFWNIADDTITYICIVNLTSVLENLGENSQLGRAFRKNTDTYHLIVSRTQHKHIKTKTSKDNIMESNNVKQVRVNIDNELKFG